MFYFVEPDDSLELIAWKLGVSMTHLFQYNPTTYYYPLHVGQRLSIPSLDSRTLNTYTVTTGDTLDSIAQTFNTTKQSIMKLNNLSSEVLVPGQKLKINSGSRIPLPSSRAPQNYVVQVGDTLDSIAQKFNVSKQSIMSFNHLSNDFIVPDQVLKIPTRSDITYKDYRSVTTYTVQVGDTLDSIANKFHTTKKAIMQLNGLASEVLKAGDILRIDVPRESCSILSPDLRALATYTVATGDTLDSIAQKFNTTKQSIIQLNKLSSEVLVPGQKLKIDTSHRITVSGLRDKTYVVQVGDTLDSIAQKFNVSKQSIMSFNHLSNDFIVPDQVLKIPTRSYRTYNNYRRIITYTVQVGDTLDSIANKFHTTKKALMQLNGLASEVLKAGDILQVESSRENFTGANIATQNDINTDLNPRSKYKFLYLHDLSLDKNIDIWKELKNENAFFFVSKMAVTAAGAPTAFHQENQLAYDFLYNAGTSGNWWSLVTDDEKFPLIQGINDPAPGYFISKTALSDCKKPLDDPTRYVDASVIPYITLPTHHMMGAELGDLCVVINTINNKIGYAIIADIGPDDSIGIGSIALAKDLDIKSSPKLGGVEDGILYIVFSQSGKESSKKCYEECYNKCTENCDEKCDKECYEKREKLWCKPKPRDQIINEAQQLFNQWGGIEKVNALFGKFPLSHTNIE